MQCSLCDISIRCLFSPGKGQGARNSAFVVLPSITNSQYNKGFITGKSVKVLRDNLQQSAFDYYITSLVKCPTSAINDFEVDNCKQYLIKEVYDIAPKVIITIGDLVTSQFLKYNYFKQVVNKATVIELNRRTTIIYPLYSERNKEVDIVEEYRKAFINLEKIYKAFINSNYLTLRMI